VPVPPRRERGVWGRPGGRAEGRRSKHFAVAALSGLPALAGRAGLPAWRGSCIPYGDFAIEVLEGVGDVLLQLPADECNQSCGIYINVGSFHAIQLPIPKSSPCRLTKAGETLQFSGDLRARCTNGLPVLRYLAERIAGLNRRPASLARSTSCPEIIVRSYIGKTIVVPSEKLSRVLLVPGSQTASVTILPPYLVLFRQYASSARAADCFADRSTTGARIRSDCAARRLPIPLSSGIQDCSVVV
jgi:hypothetical protein